MKILDTMYTKYEAEYELCRLQIETYMKNMVGVGEHIDYVGPIEKLLKEMADKKDLMNEIETFI